MRLLAVFGTRPEAVKMAPVLRALAAQSRIDTRICVTGQHRDLLDGVLGFFGIAPDIDLALMEPDQRLNRLAARAIEAVDRVLAEVSPDRLIVQGDTTTALAAALAACHRRIPVAHVEAGLRTYRLHAPWPEEANRRAISLVSDLHFAPTAAAKANLAAERLDGEAYCTGNTGIDALRIVAARLDREVGLRRSADARLPPRSGRRLLVATLHRRESFGAPLLEICSALGEIAARGDVDIAVPVHPNPRAAAAVEAALGGRERVTLLPALELAAFVRLMQRATLILTDSGGVQEESVALERPVLVLREATERAEAVTAGAARVAGTHGESILRQVSALLDDPGALGRFARRPTLFGDGRAAERIVDALLGRPVEEFAEPTAAARLQVTAIAD